MSLHPHAHMVGLWKQISKKEFPYRSMTYVLLHGVHDGSKIEELTPVSIS